MKAKTLNATVTTLWMAVEMLPIVALLLLLWAGNLVVQDVKRQELLTPSERKELQEAAAEETRECLKSKSMERERLRAIDYLTCS